MKAGTREHVKFKLLKRLLALSEYRAVGLLETLWQFAARGTPQGNIGKYSDDEIAAELEWEGETKALVDALIKARWLDPDPVHRLLIHDWQDHVPDYIKGNLAKHGREIFRPAQQPAQQDAKEPAGQPAQQPAENGTPESAPIKAYPSQSNPIRGRGPDADLWDAVVEVGKPDPDDAVEMNLVGTLVRRMREKSVTAAMVRNLPAVIAEHWPGCKSIDLNIVTRYWKWLHTPPTKTKGPRDGRHVDSDASKYSKPIGETIETD